MSYSSAEIAAHGYVAMATGSTAGKSMASVSRATKYIQLRFLYIQDLVAARVVRRRKVQDYEFCVSYIRFAHSIMQKHHHKQLIRRNYRKTQFMINGLD